MDFGHLLGNGPVNANWYCSRRDGQCVACEDGELCCDRAALSQIRDRLPQRSKNSRALFSYGSYPNNPKAALEIHLTL